MKNNKKPSVWRWVFVFIGILLTAHPALPQNHPSQHRLGAKPLTFVRKGVNYQVVTFDDLYFGYRPPVDVEHPDGNITKAAKTPMAIPPAIQALNGKKVAVTGFVIPLANQAEGANTKEFLFADELVSCLFCAMLGYDQWMIGDAVNSKGLKIADDDFDQPITIYGTFDVGPKFEDGQFAGIYRIKADGFEVKHNKFLGIF